MAADPERRPGWRSGHRALDGRPIQDFSDLNSYLVPATEPGQVLEITVLRGGEPVTLSLTLGARP